MKKFVYFVSFAYKNGYGNCCIELDHLITTHDSIRNIEKLLKDQNLKEVTVLNFQFLRQIEEDDE